MGNPDLCSLSVDHRRNTSEAFKEMWTFFLPPKYTILLCDIVVVCTHMVSSETLFWETMEKLKALGASSILVLPIEKMME